MSEAEQKNLIDELSQDITFTDESFYDDSLEDFETELFDNEMYLDDTEEVA